MVGLLTYLLIIEFHIGFCTNLIQLNLQLLIQPWPLDIELAILQRNRQRVLHLDGDGELLSRHRLSFETNFNVWVAYSEIVLSEIVEIPIDYCS